MRTGLCIIAFAAACASPQLLLADNIGEESLNILPLTDNDLALTRGQGGITNIDHIQLNHIDTDAQLQGNRADYNITGNNTVSNGVFADAQGFSTVIQNSGNNVIIQNSTIVNFSMKQ